MEARGDVNMKHTKPEAKELKKESAPEMAAPMDDAIVKPMEPKTMHEGKREEGETIMKLLKTKKVIAIYGAVVLLGVGTGYLLSRSTRGAMGSAAPSSINTGKVVGSTDAKTFKDSAVGVVQKGGSDGEGTHQLIRDGGPSQTVTLISSVVDLDQYVGKKVKVSGQTLAAKHVAWLMDVGKVELQ